MSLGTVVKQLVATQFQVVDLEESDGLFRPFQPGFRTETALVTVADGLYKKSDRGVNPYFIVLDLSVLSLPSTTPGEAG